MSLNLHGVVSQRLVPGTAQKLVPAVEILLSSAYVSELIQQGRTDDIKAVMARSNEIGMMTFDQSLYDLYVAGRISVEEALRNADSHTDLQLRIKLSRGVSPDTVRMSIVPGANLHSRK